MGVSKKVNSLSSPPGKVLLDSSGMLEKASRCLGTVRVMEKVALRAGSSQQGKALLVDV
jgi:hypothetical protein